MKKILLVLVGLVLASNSFGKEVKKVEKQDLPNLTAGQMELLNEQKLLEKKLDMCLISMNSGSGNSRGLCKDALEFQEYLSKGDDMTYFEYHLKAGNFNNGVLPTFSENMKKLPEALKGAR